jgi:RNA polymerase sigma-70 factor, ECF subfamily
MKPLEVEYDPQRPVVEAIRTGDPHAMAELVRAQGRWVRAVVFGVLGRTDELDDVCQKVWILVWRECRKLDDPGRWRSWLYRIARNAATDALRSGQRRKRLQGAPGAGGDMLNLRPAGERSEPQSEVLAKEQHQAMLDAIAELPELYREPFVLKHVEGWSYAEIAEVLGLPTDTVETRLVRARRLLRERLSSRVL